MSIRDEPFYTLPAGELAAWIEQQGGDTWWNVDGDSILTGILSFPCPGDELADELRRINRLLLVQDPQKRREASGQEVDRTALDGLVDYLGKNASIAADRKPAWTNDRLLYLCWHGSDAEWLLVEDLETTQNSRNDLAVNGKK
jgi:hypothetical protein